MDDLNRLWELLDRVAHDRKDGDFSAMHVELGEALELSKTIRAQLSAQSVSAVQPVAITAHVFKGPKGYELSGRLPGDTPLHPGMNTLYTHPADADAVDAKRYRYLRNTDPQPPRELDVCNNRIVIVDGDCLDATIDAAIAAQSTEGAKG